VCDGGAMAGAGWGLIEAATGFAGAVWTQHRVSVLWA
jgi:hypothetical protein